MISIDGRLREKSNAKVAMNESRDANAEENDLSIEKIANNRRWQFYKFLNLLTNFTEITIIRKIMRQILSFSISRKDIFFQKSNDDSKSFSSFINDLYLFPLLHKSFIKIVKKFRHENNLKLVENERFISRKNILLYSQFISSAIS